MVLDAILEVLKVLFLWSRGVDGRDGRHGGGTGLLGALGGLLLPLTFFCLDLTADVLQHAYHLDLEIYPALPYRLEDQPHWQFASNDLIGEEVLLRLKVDIVDDFPDFEIIAVLLGLPVLKHKRVLLELEEQVLLGGDLAADAFFLVLFFELLRVDAELFQDPLQEGEVFLLGLELFLVRLQRRLVVLSFTIVAFGELDLLLHSERVEFQDFAFEVGLHDADLFVSDCLSEVVDILIARLDEQVGLFNLFLRGFNFGLKKLLDHACRILHIENLPERFLSEKPLILEREFVYCVLLLVIPITAVIDVNVIAATPVTRSVLWRRLRLGLCFLLALQLFDAHLELAKPRRLELLFVLLKSFHHIVLKLYFLMLGLSSEVALAI